MAADRAGLLGFLAGGRISGGGFFMADSLSGTRGEHDRPAPPVPHRAEGVGARNWRYGSTSTRGTRMRARDRGLDLAPLRTLQQVIAAARAQRHHGQGRVLVPGRWEGIA